MPELTFIYLIYITFATPSPGDRWPYTRISLPLLGILQGRWVQILSFTLHTLPSFLLLHFLLSSFLSSLCSVLFPPMYGSIGRQRGRMDEHAKLFPLSTILFLLFPFFSCLLFPSSSLLTERWRRRRKKRSNTANVGKIHPSYCSFSFLPFLFLTLLILSSLSPFLQYMPHSPLFHPSFLIRFHIKKKEKKEMEKGEVEEQVDEKDIIEA